MTVLNKLLLAPALAAATAIGTLSTASAMEIKSSDVHPMGYPTTDAIAYMGDLLDIWTNGTVSPEMAMIEGAKILRKHLNPFIMYEEAGEEVVSSEVMKTTEEDMEVYRKLQQPLADLDLSVQVGDDLGPRRKLAREDGARERLEDRGLDQPLEGSSPVVGVVAPIG